jgi:hypothetical protein
MNRGSRPGERRGGRQKGTRNKKTAEKVAALEASGEMPLDFMLRLMRDPTVHIDKRADMAKAAAPYCHARLATIDHKSSDGSIVVPVLNVIESEPTYRSQ